MAVVIEHVRATAVATQPILLSLLRLRSWPDLPQLPPQDMVDMARICALLSWRATAGVIVARILDLPKERVQNLLQQLHARGCLQLVTQPDGTPAAQAASPVVHDAEAQPGNSFITKIWQRLAARH